MFFSFDPNGSGMVFHDKEKDARAAADVTLKEEREVAEGVAAMWSDKTGLICWGQICCKAHKVRILKEGTKTKTVTDYMMKSVGDNDLEDDE